MKILIVSTYPVSGEKHSNTGGVASYTKNLIKNLPRKIEDSCYILCNKLDNKVERYREDDVNIIRCFDKSLKCLLQIYREIEEIKPDVIHIQQELNLYGGISNAYLLQWMLRFLKKYNIIITLHGVVSIRSINADFVRENNSFLPSWLVKFAFYIIYKPLCFWAKQIIVHEAFFKEILINEYGVDNSKIKIIHHGVEELIALPKDQARVSLDLSMEKDTALFMGYLTGYKGIDLLIEGFSECCKVNKNAFLFIGAGKHPRLQNNQKYLIEYQRLQDKAYRLIPKDQFTWLGFIKEQDIVNYISASDVILFPYTTAISSSGPMAIAMGFEKLFLASDVFEGVLDHEILFKRNKNELAIKLEKAFFDKDAALDYRRALKATRSWRLVSIQTKELYNSCL